MEINIKVNLDNLTIGDLEQFEAWGSGAARISEVLPLLERIVEVEDGRSVRELPYKHLKEILSAIGDELKGQSDPKN